MRLGKLWALEVRITVSVEHCDRSVATVATLQGSTQLHRACLEHTGFAVVKKGKDKRSGEPVAIKVRKLNMGMAPCMGGDTMMQMHACAQPVPARRWWTSHDMQLETTA